MKPTASILPALAAALAAALFPAGAAAQEPKSRMVFHPGSKTPEIAGGEAALSPAPNNAPGAIDADIAKRLDGFFGHLVKRETKEAYDLLTKDSTIGDKAEDVIALREKTEQSYALFGAVEGYEILGAKRIGTRLAGVTALSLGERFPLRWQFSFYRGKTGWKLIDIQVDDRVAALFGGREGEADDAGESPARWPR